MGIPQKCWVNNSNGIWAINLSVSAKDHILIWTTWIEYILVVVDISAFIMLIPNYWLFVQQLVFVCQVHNIHNLTIVYIVKSSSSFISKASGTSKTDSKLSTPVMTYIWQAWTKYILLYNVSFKNVYVFWVQFWT